MAIYAADIRIGVVNKNVLTGLNKLLNTSLSISKRLNRELSKLGKVNKIRIDNKQALASLDAIQKRINKINSTPIAPRTRGRGGGGGGSGGGAGGGGLRGSAMRAATASAALIPGVSPLAVGAGAGALGGMGLAGAAVGVGVAGLVQGAVATAQFAASSATLAADMKKMKIALAGVVPDMDSYNTALENVDKISDRFAISRADTIKNFTRLQASASASGFSVDEVTEAFEGLAAGTIATGGDVEKLNGIMLAASQVFAKGKVAAEEIRGQIGERLPGAMAVFADSMDISGKQLDKLLQEGKVTMEDFLKFTKRLGEIHGKTADKMVKDSANAGARLSKEWKNFSENLGVIFQPIGAFLQDTITFVLKGINAALEGFNKLMGLGGIKDPNFSKTKNKAPETSEEKDLQKRIASFDKIKKNLEIENQFIKDKFQLGEKEATLRKEIAEFELQVGPERAKQLGELLKANKALTEEFEDQVNVQVELEALLKDQAKNLKDLANPINQLKTITEAFEDSFSNAIREVVRGTKSIGDAVASMLNRIADAMIQNAADMAAAAASNALIKFLGNAFLSNIGTPKAPGPLPPVPDKITQTGFDYSKFASGGYVDRPTNAIVGEGGEGEYIIPESKLASSLSRFQAGHRGSAVVPGGVGNSGGSGGGSGEVTVNYTGPTLNFNGDEYVPRSAVPQIINSAAMAGATAGRANTMKDLKNSRSQRSRLGL